MKQVTPCTKKYCKLFSDFFDCFYNIELIETFFRKKYKHSEYPDTELKSKNKFIFFFSIVINSR